jgi:hypothetical protein
MKFNNVLLIMLLSVNFVQADTTSAGRENLLLNPDFEFHAFENHRLGKAISYLSHNVAYWNTDAWGDITVTRESHIPSEIRPDYTTHNIVSIEPGKKIWQFFTLPEADLALGDHVSLFAGGYQTEPNAIKVCIKLLKLDSEDGTWSPADYGMVDKIIYPKYSRGEPVVAKQYATSSMDRGKITLKIDNAEIIGRFTNDKESRSDNINTIGMVVEFENSAAKSTVYIYTPCLSKTTKAFSKLPVKCKMIPYYRYIPRTIQKLWKGQAIHIIVMGSSIDRGSASPSMVPYDENPNSPTFKKPLCTSLDFDPNILRPDLNGYVGQWRHFFSYAGRLRLELMRKFNLPASKICLNFMARDGSSVSEAISGLQQYCSLSLPPNAELNGYKTGTRWQELHPELFSRPQGPGPDLIIFGSGANEKTDTPDEVAVFEGTIRWIQQHYPYTEFLFCPFQQRGGYTPNNGDLQALALGYQIPFIDFGKISDDLGRWCNPYAPDPIIDGHPQAAFHYIWFKQLEKAFECWDPIEPGQAQLQLPQRVHQNSYGWEGQIVSYDSNSNRINNCKFIFDDTAINCWGNSDANQISVYVDGEFIASRRPFSKTDVRNSLFAYGRCRLGDRQVLEIRGENAKLNCVDAKVCPNRIFFGIANKLWKTNDAKIALFDSKWGSPYGATYLSLEPNKAIEIETVCTDVSVAYVDTPNGGLMRVFVDDIEKLAQMTNISFIDIDKNNHFMENRKGILGMNYGLHKIRIEAIDRPVSILGIFTYDSRSNRDFERRITGYAYPNDTVEFTLPFKARPIVICSGGLKISDSDIKSDRIRFSGDGFGIYEVIGE